MKKPRASVQSFVRFALIASVLVIASAPLTANAMVRNFMAVINGGQEVPLTNSPAFGVGFFTFDTDTDMLCYSITFSAADLLAPESDCHFHGPATPGVDGVIMFQ